MDDDFNTPEALAVLFELVREINTLRKTDEQRAAALGAELRRLGEVLGILQLDAESFLKAGPTSYHYVGSGGAQAGGSAEVEFVAAGLTNADIDALIEQRTQAKAEKNWAEADRIRDELKAQGIVLEDGAGGTTWRRD